MARRKDKVKIVQMLAEELGTDVDNLVPTVEKYLREREELEEEIEELK